MRNHLKVGALTALLSIQGCAGPAVSLTEISTAPPLPISCNPRIYEQGQLVPSSATLLAEVSFGDMYGFMGGSDCDRPVVRERLRNQACRSGADAAKITREAYPSAIGSGCYRLSAQLYKLQSVVAPTTSAPSPINAQSDALTLESAKKECAELGFKTGTENFGKCVLQLTH